MVQGSRSLLIQQLFHGGFKEDDDDDEDEDESHELVKRHPSSDERQGFGRKEHTHQELIQGVLEAGRSNKGSDTSTKQNFSSRPKLLASPKLQKHPEAELQSPDGDYLQLEKDIIEEGSKKLLQIHSEFLIGQQNPARQAQQEPETTPKDSNCFSKNSHKQQQVHGGEGLVSPGLVFPPPKLVSKNKEEKDQMVLVADAQQSYGSVEDALLSTHFTSPVSPEEEKRKQRCFAALSNATVAARELNANISNPVFSTGIEKKSSISGCTESLASDRGSSTDSVNGRDEVIQDVTSVEKILNFEDQFNVLQSSADVRPSTMETTANVRIARVEEVVQQVESAVPALQLETAESWKNRRSETTEITKDWRIETSAEYKQAFEENHVEFFSKVHDRAVEFKSSVLEHSTAKVFDKISVKRDSSNIVAGEQSSLEPASLILAGRAEQIGDAGSFKLGKDTVGATGGAKVLVNEISLVEKELQQQDVLSALHNLSSNEEEIRQSESPRKHCAGAASLRTCLREEVIRGDDPVVPADTNKGEFHMTADTKPLEKVVASENDDTFMISSPMGSPKEQLADIAHHEFVYLLDEEDERVTLTSPEGKCRSPVCQATETSLIEIPVLVSSLVQKASTVQANRRSLIVERSEIHTTAAVTSPQMVQTPGSPIVESLPTSPPAAAAAAVNKRRKSNRKTGSSKKSKTKKTACVQHQDARTMVFVRSDTRVAYNNGPHFATNADHSEVSQHNAMANVMNPCLYDFAGSSQPVQAAPFMSHETDVHLLQAQTSAKDAMVAATSALAQSHCEWSRMRTQATDSRLTVMRESQIAAIAASVAAAAMVAKAAVEAARAIQEASKEFLGQLGGPSQPNFEKSGFARSAEVLARDHDKILEMPNCQPVQLSNPSTINTAVRQIKNQKPGASSGESNDDVVEAKPRERSVRFMKQEVVSEDQKVAGEGVCKKRTRHEMEQTQPVSAHASSHAELRDPGGETFRCTQGASNGHELDELVEVMTDEVGILGGWFVAKVLMKTDREAFVQYNELFRDDGCTPRSNLFPLSSFRDEDTCRRTQHSGDRRWLRPLHPVNKTRKLCCSSKLPQSWTVGNHVDAYSDGGWWEGIVVEIDRADEANVKIQLPGGKGIQTMKVRDVRPSLIWAGDDWRPWKENSTSQNVQDEPSSKRVKLEAAADNGKTKREETSRKEKTQSLKKLVQESTSGTPVSEALLATPRVSRRSAEAAARKTANNPHAKLNNNNRSLNVSRTVRFPAANVVRHKTHRHEQQAPTNASSRSARVGHFTTSKKAPPALIPFSSARKGAVSTRLQLKTEAAKCKQLTNMALSSVIQKGAKYVSTRRDVMKLKSKAVPTKLLKALKNTSELKFPRRSHKKY